MDLRLSDILLRGFDNQARLSILQTKALAYYNLIFKRKIFVVDSNILSNKGIKLLLQAELELLEDRVIVPIKRKSLKNFRALHDLWDERKVIGRPRDHGSYAEWLDEHVREVIENEPWDFRFTETFSDFVALEAKNNYLGVGSRNALALLSRAQKVVGKNEPLTRDSVYKSYASEKPVIRHKVKGLADVAYFISAAEWLGKQKPGIKVDFLPRDRITLSKFYTEPIWSFSWQKELSKMEKKVLKSPTRLSPLAEPIYIAKELDWSFIRDELRNSNSGKNYFNVIEKGSSDPKEIIEAFIEYVQHCDKTIRNKKYNYWKPWEKKRKMVELASRAQAYAPLLLGIFTAPLTQGISLIGGTVTSAMLIWGEHLKKEKDALRRKLEAEKEYKHLFVPSESKPS